MLRGDLHTHTTASDGLLSPTELVLHAHEMGLNVLAITDHDTLGGIEQAQRAAQPLGMHIIPGVELSAEHEPEIHILGFGIDASSPKLASLLDQTRQERRTRDALMMERLQAQGLPITWETVLAESGDGVVGRPHFARALMKAGVAQTMAEAFERFLLPGKAGYVSRVRPSASCCIAAIRAAGGVAVLAHPRLLGLLPYELERLLDLLTRQGLQGIEAYSPGNRPGDCRRFERLAERYHLFMTGGSDFHGDGRPLCGLGGVPAWPQDNPPPFIQSLLDAQPTKG